MICIKCELTDGIVADSIQLIYQAIFLDTVERKKLAETTTRGIHQIVTKTITHHLDVVGDDEFSAHRIGICCRRELKDIRVLIRRNDGGDRLDVECVAQLNILLQSATHISLNPSLSRKIIPRQFYHIKDNQEPIYYIPFCHDPSSFNFLYTSTIHFGRINKPELELYLRPGQYTVTLLYRYVNELRISSGVCGFAYTLE